MCTRFSLAIERPELLAYLNKQFNILDIKGDHILPRYNITPTSKVISVIYDGHNYRAGNLVFGLLSKYKQRHLNARSETIFETTSFKNLIKTNRCLIIADGYFEWDKDKHPHYFKDTNNDLLVFAGIYQSRTDENGMKHHEMAILTKEANKDIQSISHRMPVVLDKKQQLLYLESFKAQENYFVDTFISSSDVLLCHHLISNEVNSVYNDSPMVLEKIY